MRDTAWLKEVCSSEPDRHHLSLPFTAIIGGKPFTIATNGHHLVELPGDCGNPMPAKVTQESLEKIVIPTPTDATPVDFPALKAFVRECMGGAVVSCSTCGNSGEIIEPNARRGHWYRQCPNCHGAVIAFVHCYVGGVLFNARVLDPVTRNLTADGPVRWYQATPTTQALIDGGSWRAVVMPMREENPHPEAPRFEIEGAQARAA